MIVITEEADNFLKINTKNIYKKIDNIEMVVIGNLQKRPNHKQEIFINSDNVGSFLKYLLNFNLK